MTERETGPMSETAIESGGATVGKIEERGKGEEAVYLATHLASGAQLVAGTFERALDWIIETGLRDGPRHESS